MQLKKPLSFALAWASTIVAIPVDFEENSLTNRTSCQDDIYRQTEPTSNSNPHQNFRFKQVSGTTDCTNNPSGGASVTETFTIGWSVSSGFAGGFITGGFSVSESQSTGHTNTFGCKTNTGTHTGSLCVFERIQVTAFTAQTRTCSTSGCSGGSTQCGPWSTGVISAPNSQQGSCYYNNFQINLPCGDVGSVWAVNKGPAGGPQFLPCSPSLV